MASEQEIYTALKQHFDFDDFRDGQYQPIAEILNGRDARQYRHFTCLRIVEVLRQDV